MATGFESSLLQENIEEYVHDDNKVVTCKWLSLTHSININTAKRALHTYVDTQRNKGGNDDINVTYFVAGLGKSKDGDLLHKCAVVPETELDVVKKSLSTITSCHIFSVQKAKLKDYTALYMTDYEIIKNNLDKCNSFSSIKCPWVALKANLPSPKKQQVQKKPETKENTSPTNVPSKNNNASGTKLPAKKAEPKGSIASMFASSAKRDTGSDKSSKPASKTDTSAKGKTAEKKGGMMAFVSKKIEKPAKENTSQNAAKETKTETEQPKSKVTPKDSKVEPEPKRKKTKTVDSDEEGPDKKKRRRIRTDLFDSSDEEDNGDRSEGDEPEEMEPEEEEASITVIPSSQEEDKDVEEDKVDLQPKEARAKHEETSSTTSSGKKRKRTKKVVTKHYQDEDGFMVTKKETVWESETDDEAEDPPAKEEPTAKKANIDVRKAAPKNTSAKAEPKGKGASKKTAVSPQKNKQTSLMSFFKKK